MQPSSSFQNTNKLPINETLNDVCIFPSLFLEPITEFSILIFKILIVVGCLCWIDSIFGAQYSQRV